ncbi:oligosaccharide flippase family protein [Mucilaginibacter panaciglaebae]|uniref:O-antigen/teichoic acid export membrane protein n=1 Tax=Mucilaginibacter panaciglaebae TaxID=502331 RepID=A0ABP7WQU6_9SPHI
MKAAGHLKNFSANALQLVANNIFGLVIFYVLSTGLSKADFGRLNLVLAILLAAFNVLSCGIDQLIVKKIAADDDRQSALSLYIIHTLITGIILYSMLLAGYTFIPNNTSIYQLLLLVGIGKLMIYFSTPYKQAANGLEKFKLMAWLSVISNFVRCACLLVCLLVHRFSLSTVVAVFIAGDILEFVIGLILFKRWAGILITLKWNKRKYFELVKEALPQIGVVIITSSLARFDWIFIGIMLSAIKLAEYSFAYKVFEIALLPLSAVAPLLIPRFTKMFKQGDININGMKFLMSTEAIIAGLSVLLINIYWSPVIDWVTHGKYGAVNQHVIFFLSLCLPLLYLENFLWTMFFAQGRMKMILHAFIITLAVNVLGDIILIPLFQNEGAAIAFLLACIAQIIFYLDRNNIAGLQGVWQPVLTCTICAVVAGLGARSITADNWLVIPVAIVFYGGLLLITGQINHSAQARLKAIFS